MPHGNRDAATFWGWNRARHKKSSLLQELSSRLTILSLAVEGLCTGHDLEDLGGDSCLAGFVV